MLGLVEYDVSIPHASIPHGITQLILFQEPNWSCHVSHAHNKYVSCPLH